jgi:hypothetical protein
MSAGCKERYGFIKLGRKTEVRNLTNIEVFIVSLRNFQPFSCSVFLMQSLLQCFASEAIRLSEDSDAY